MKPFHINWLCPILCFVFIFSACSKDSPTSPEEPEGPKEQPVSEAEATAITINPNQTHQTMIGFGGAITWNSPRIVNSNRKSEIIDKIVSDLGVDMVRLKNWYYPVDYPENKTTNQMEVSWFKDNFVATNEIFDLLKSKNSKIKILFSSWGPSSALKNNNHLNSGTLKKKNGEFIYDEYVTYWEEVMDHILFMPDYVSIQNEPTFEATWESCKFLQTETDEFPSYEIAFNKVAKIMNALPNPPVMIGPESPNLDYWNFDLFADELKDNSNLGLYAYHPYSFGSDNTPLADIQQTLSEMSKAYNNKPNIMSEFDGFEWMKTARFINSTVREGNSSAYLYWKLIWDETSDDSMIIIDANGNYTQTKFYYLMKQYTKFVDEGYVRVDVSSENAALDQVAFVSPDGKTLTIISVNPTDTDVHVKFQVQGSTLTPETVYQSLETQPYLALHQDGYTVYTLKGESITTTVLPLN